MKREIEQRIASTTLKTADVERCIDESKKRLDLKTQAELRKRERSRSKSNTSRVEAQVTF